MVTLFAQHLLAQIVVAQGVRCVGIWKLIPWLDFGKLCRCSTRAQEKLIYSRALPVEGKGNRTLCQMGQ